MQKYVLILIACIISSTVNSQDYRQTVRGYVYDKESHTPIKFATISLSNSTFTIGVTSDEKGKFKIENVPVGRISLKVIHLAYETMTLNNPEVTMGKELVLNIELVESTIQLDEITVKASNHKEKPLNSFASNSARTFAIEESKRYAGSANDVSRMAMNFAGVKMSAETTNEIVIRGNSPVGLLFRLEGIDIPNPNHFGDGGTTGGPISMLNNNVLSNSDFLTGAFPAEYANTISGIFDLSMRSGNNETYEFLGQVGLMGFEFGAEGPVLRSRGSSFLVNYRYSTMKLLSLMGMNAMGSAVPEYQDLSFKLNFPSKKIGSVSFFGFGGNSNIQMIESDRDTTQEREQLAFESNYEMDMKNNNYSGVIGFVHSYVFGKSAYTKLIIASSTIWNYNSWDSLSIVNRKPTLLYHSDFQRTNYMARFFLNKKFNRKNTIRTGIFLKKQDFNLLDSIYDGSIHGHRILRDFNGSDHFLQPFIQYKHRFNDQLHLNLGLNTLIQLSNWKYSVEPRAGLSWVFIPGNSLSFAYGLHSLITPIDVLNQKVLSEDGSYITPNKNLEFTKSHHFVIGYDKIISSKIRLKSEIYYQYITNAVVDQESCSYSLLNKGSYTYEDVGVLKNSGTGFNYGLEFTAEKFMDHGTYFLSTLSLYQSKYRGSDGILRNTAFNSNYVFNVLGGKEFLPGRKKENSKYIKKLVLDGKINYAGGMRYTPVNLEESRLAGQAVYYSNSPYSKQLPYYFRIDLRLGFKFTGKRSSQEIALDIQNVTNRQNAYDIQYDAETGELKKLSFGMMPDLLYRITF